MGHTFTTKLIAAALTLSVLAGAGNQASGHFKTPLQRIGKQAAKTAQSSRHASINALISKPGNSQDFRATGSGTWQLEGYSTYNYDAQGRLTARVITTPNSNQFISRETMTYDSRGNEAEYRGEKWNGTSWDQVSGFRRTTIYNAAGNKTSVIYEDWSSTSNAMEITGSELMTYDTSNRMTSLTYQAWDGTGWVPTDRMNLHHNGGVATSAVMQQYNGFAWEDIYRALNLTWHVLYEIPSAYELEAYMGNIWVKEEKYTAIYDQYGGHQGIYQSWTGTAWENASRETVGYDPNRNYIGSKDERWDAMTGAWEFSWADRHILTYSGIDVTERIYQDSGFAPAGLLEDRFKEVYSNFQSFAVAGLNKTLAAFAVNVYPNPATSFLTVDFPENKNTALTATLLDITGKTWLTENFKADQPKQLNMEALPKGIYLLQLKTAKGTSVQKVVKQ